MTTTYQTGSSSTDFITVMVTNTALAGTGSFQTELTDLLASGFKVECAYISGTTHTALLIKKKY